MRINGSGSSAVPPVVELLTKPARPIGGLTRSFHHRHCTRHQNPVSSHERHTLFIASCFSNEVAVTMTAGTGGLYTATVPTTGLSAGQMLRWRVEAKDSSTNIGTAPRFALMQMTMIAIRAPWR